MKFPFSWIAASGALATLLILGYARLHAQPPKTEKRADSIPALIITTTSEDVLRRVKAAIKDVEGEQHSLTEIRMVNGKPTPIATRIRMKDVTMINRAVKGIYSQSTPIVTQSAVIFGGKSLEKIRAALQGVDARLFQARLVDSRALMNGQLVSRGLLLPAKKPTTIPQQGN